MKTKKKVLLLVKKFLLIFSLIFILSGCGAVTYKNIHISKSSPKYQRLKTLLSSVGSNQAEASRLAKIAIEHSKVLANRYNLVLPPLFHNFLVNNGSRKRGLCFHFVEDLMERINQDNYNSFKFLWGRANANRLNEHNVIVVVGNKDSNFKNGIILDAWRNSGDLFFCRVKDDPKYKFKHWLEGDLRIAK